MVAWSLYGLGDLTVLRLDGDEPIRTVGRRGSGRRGMHKWRSRGGEEVLWTWGGEDAGFPVQLL